MASKEELLNDIGIITTFSEKYNMKNPAQVKLCIKFFNDKKVFKSNVGDHYMYRLNQIMNGGDFDQCFVCKRNPAYDGVLCEACMRKYTQGKKQFYGQDDLAALNTLFEDDNKTKAGTNGSNQVRMAAEVAKNKMSNLTGTIQSRLQEDDVLKVKSDISSKMIDAGEKAKQFAKDNDLGGKAAVAKEKAKGNKGSILMILATIAVIAVVSYIGFWTIAGIIALVFGVLQGILFFKQKDKAGIVKAVVPLIIGAVLLSSGGGSFGGISKNSYLKCTTKEVKQAMSADYATAVSKYKDKALAVSGRNKQMAKYTLKDDTICLDNGCWCKFKSENDRDRLIEKVPPLGYVIVYGTCYELNPIGMWFISVDDIEVVE